MTTETATLAGGCFWCLEAVYDELNGVLSVESGYMGGRTPDPTYAEVCDGNTGHAEVVQITFDPGVVSFRELLEVFFTVHDPTTLNRQGSDAGTQYRSAIFHHTPEQRATAGEVIAALTAAGVWGRPIVTEVVPALAAWLLLLVVVREPPGTAARGQQAVPEPAHVAASGQRPAGAGKRGAGLRWSDARAFAADYWVVVALGAVFTLARFSEAFLVLRVSAFDVSLLWGPAAIAVMSIVYALVSYPAGLLADRVDARGLLAAGLVVLIAADAMLALATTPWMALGGVALWGLHLGLTQGVLAAMVAGTAPAALRGSAFGVFNLVSGVMLLVASVLAGVLWQHVSPAATFVAGGALCCVTLLGLLWVRPLRPGQQ